MFGKAFDVISNLTGFVRDKSESAVIDSLKVALALFVSISIAERFVTLPSWVYVEASHIVDEKAGTIGVGLIVFGVCAVISILLFILKTVIAGVSFLYYVVLIIAQLVLLAFIYVVLFPVVMVLAFICGLVAGLLGLDVKSEKAAA